MLWGDPIGVFSNMKLLDQGEQTKPVHAPKGIGPLKLSVPVVDVSDEGVVKMRNGGDVPGVTGQGACAETGYVIGKASDDDFDHLQGKSGGRERACRRGLRTYSPDPG